MDKLRFYEIDPEYINYLRTTVDNRVPECVKSGHAKPYCGIVLEINEQKYYAPISSFNIQQQTNFVIMDGKKAISSVRFCFMIPVPDFVLTEKDFSKEEENYRALLEKEYRFCKNNAETIYKLARQIYKRARNKKDPVSKNCCDFGALEAACKEYQAKKSA